MPLAMPFRSLQRVYFDDLDPLNILHNVRYLLFIERARGELLTSLGFRWDDPVEVNPDKFHVVAAHEVQYLAPVRGEGTLVVEVWPTRIGTSSLILAATIRSIDGKIKHSEDITRLVRLDPKTNRPCPWSERFRNAMVPLVGQTPATS